MAVRSDVLALSAHLPVTTTHVLLVVPAGRTAIVKDIRVAAVTATGSTVVRVSIRRGANTVGVMRATLAGDAVVAQSGSFLVLEPGDELIVVGTGDNGYRVYASGALLFGAPT